MKKDSLDATAIVKAEKLGISFHKGHHRRHRLLIKDINLAIKAGELVGLTGSSGVGKSTLGDTLLGLRQPACGDVYWGEHSIYGNGKDNQIHHRRYYQKIYQDPAASFPPRQTVGEAMLDVVRYYKKATNPEETRILLKALIEPLGLNSSHLERHPHRLSGGEMQRLALARILLVEPRFLVADEPTSRLDLSVQAHIIHLLADLVRTQNCSVLLISHDIQLIEAVCDSGWRLARSTHGQPEATLLPLSEGAKQK